MIVSHDSDDSVDDAHTAVEELGKCRASLTLAEQSVWSVSMGALLQFVHHLYPRVVFLML